MHRSLNPDELLVLGGLLRILIRLDGTYSAAENTALRTVLDHLGPSEGFFDPAAAPNAPSIWDLIGRAARELPDEASVKLAAGRIADRAARESICAAVVAVAESDGVVPSEQPLLDWLAAWRDSARA